jgi:hypothetical protein
MTRCINFLQDNDIIEDGQAVKLLVMDFPKLSSTAHGGKSGTPTSTEPFKSAGSGNKERLPKYDALHDSKGTVDRLKFYGTRTTRLAGLGSK